MKTSSLAMLLVGAAVTCIEATSQVTSDFKYVRLNKTDAMVLVVDHQIGLATFVRDYNPSEFRQNVLAHATLGKIFDLPTILTTSAETGPNGHLPREILELWPNAPLIRRAGEVNAWDNSEFRKAVIATGRKQVIIAGIATEVCTTFLALSLIEAGYSVWANTEASGTTSDKIAFDANRRMEKAGVTLVGTFAIVGELMRDWRNTPGYAEVLPFFDQYAPSLSLLTRAHGNAVQNGTLSPGQAELLSPDI